MKVYETKDIMNVDMFNPSGEVDIVNIKELLTTKWVAYDDVVRIFKRFDEYACIKNDDWYLDLKKEYFGEVFENE